MFPRSKDEMIEELDSWVNDLNDRVNEALVIVEGKKDVEALRNIGVTIGIVHMNKGLSILTFLEALKNRERPFEDLNEYETMIILTDWDRTGGRLASKLKDACQNLGLKFDLEVRRELARLTGKWIRDVESLDSIMK